MRMTSRTTRGVFMAVLMAAAAGRGIVRAGGSGDDRAAAQALPAPAAGAPYVLVLFDRTSLLPSDVRVGAAWASRAIEGDQVPRQQVGVAEVGPLLTMVHEFTTDKAALRAAMDGVAASAGPAFEPASAPVARPTRAVRTLCEALRSLPDAKALVVLSRPRASTAAEPLEEAVAMMNTCTAARVSVQMLDVTRLPR